MSGLEPLRARLDELDEQIARLLAERFAICRDVARHKHANAIATMQPGRVAEVEQGYRRRGAELGTPAAFTSAFCELLIGATCDMEDALIEELADGDAARAAERSER